MSDHPPARARVFDYAYEVDPAMSALGWRHILLAYLAVVVPLVGLVLPRDGETHWGAVAAALAVAAGTIVLNAFYLRRMLVSGGWEEPPPLVVLVQAVIATVAIGALNFGAGGDRAFYRPMILVPTMIVALIGNRAMLWVSALTAMATLVGSTWAQGAEPSHLFVLVLSYGTTWGVVLVMFRQVSERALDSERLKQGMTDAAVITAHADHLDEGLQRLLPVVGAWSEAHRITVFVAGRDGWTLFDHWPVGTDPCDPPPRRLVELAVDAAGAAVDGETAVVVADAEVPGGRLVAVVEGPARNRFDAVTYQFQLTGVAEQLAMLVGRSDRIAHLETLSSTDGLTGLPNRRAFEDRLEVERAAALQRSTPLTLVILDLDDFKLYNDTYGHPAGDDLLRSFADVLRTGIRSSDMVARYGGEEFCLLLPSTTSDGARALIHNLRKRFGALSDDARPTFSAGIATWNGVETDHSFVMRADDALYAAKEQGKDRSVAM